MQGFPRPTANPITGCITAGMLTGKAGETAGHVNQGANDLL